MTASLRRRLLLAAVYASVPALFLCAEAVLRTARPDLRTPLLTEVTADGSAWREVNRSALERYFDRSSPLVPELKPALLRKEKGETFRIVCLGGSTMFGTPYQMTATIPGLVRRQLRAAYPGRAIEVVNLGASAINSNVIRDLLPGIRSLEPDLVLLYMGHNEFYGPDGVSANVLERAIPGFITLKYRLRDLALYRVLFPRRRAGAERNLMREVSRGGAVQEDSPEERFVLGRFGDNLGAILDFWNGERVPVLVSDVSSNLLFPPFLPDTSDTPGRVNARREFLAGTTALARGDTLGARGHLLAARDHDLLKFRAPSVVNEIIRRTAGERGVPVLSTDSLFRELSGGIPGDNLFWEHLHPNLTGYYEIAGLFVREILRRGYLGSEPARRVLLPRDADSLAVCWLDRAYGDLSIAHLTGRWPFENYRREPEVLRGDVPAGLAAIVRAVYDRKIPWDRGCYESAAWFWRNGDAASAQTTYEALLEEHPGGFYAQYLLGNFLAKRGERKRARALLEGSVRSNPSYVNARLDLGLLLVNEGEFTEAVHHLESGIRLPDAARSPQMLSMLHYGLGAARANAGEYDRALNSLNEALRLHPGNADAARLRASVLAVRGRAGG